MPTPTVATVTAPQRLYRVAPAKPTTKKNSASVKYTLKAPRGPASHSQGR